MENDRHEGREELAGVAIPRDTERVLRNAGGRGHRCAGGTCGVCTHTGVTRDLVNAPQLVAATATVPTSPVYPVGVIWSSYISERTQESPRCNADARNVRSLVFIITWDSCDARMVVYRTRVHGVRAQNLWGLERCRDESGALPLSTSFILKIRHYYCGINTDIPILFEETNIYHIYIYMLLPSFLMVMNSSMHVSLDIPLTIKCSKFSRYSLFVSRKLG